MPVSNNAQPVCQRSTRERQIRYQFHSKPRRRVGPERAGHRPPPGETSRSPRGRLPRMTDVTRILSAIEQGDPNAADQLLPLVYDELRRLAAVQMAREKPGQTLDATALVHEAYLRLVDEDRARPW